MGKTPSICLQAIGINGSVTRRLVHGDVVRGRERREYTVYGSIGVYVVVPFGSASLRESGGNRRGFGLGGRRIQIRLVKNIRKRSKIAIS